MRAERALRMAGGARCIDDERRSVGRELGRKRLKTLDGSRVVRHAGCEYRGEAGELVVLVGEHGARIDHHDLAHLRQPIDDGHHLVYILLVLGHHDARATVAQLVFRLRRRRRRVDAVGDGAECLRPEVGKHPFLARVADDGDALATRQTELRQAVGGAPDERRIFAPGAFAVDAELLCAVSDPGGLLPRALDEQARRCLASQHITHLARHRRVNASVARRARANRRRRVGARASRRARARTRQRRSYQGRGAQGWPYERRDLLEILPSECPAR